MNLDLAELGQLARRLGVDRLAAVANQGYFQLHKPGVGGWALANSPGVIVREGLLSAVPHELGHSFGLLHRHETAPGFWVDGNKAFDGATDFMSEGVETRVGNGDRWITLHNSNRLLNTLATSNSFASLNVRSAGDSLFVAFGVSRTDAVHLYRSLCRSKWRSAIN